MRDPMTPTRHRAFVEDPTSPNGDVILAVHPVQPGDVDATLSLDWQGASEWSADELLDLIEALADAVVVLDPENHQAKLRRAIRLDAEPPPNRMDTVPS